jgi:hypothetical protein
MTLTLVARKFQGAGETRFLSEKNCPKLFKTKKTCDFENNTQNGPNLLPFPEIFGII